MILFNDIDDFGKNDVEEELKQKFLLGLKGDNTQYQYFLREVANMIRKIISKKIPNQDVEDITQEILISMHKARHTYDGERPLMPWIYSIIKFRMNDHFRKLYKISEYDFLEIEDQNVAGHDEVENHELKDDVSKVLKFANKKERYILKEMHMKGHTAKEVGQKIGMKESAVKVAAFRAMEKIRIKYGKR